MEKNDTTKKTEDLNFLDINSFNIMLEEDVPFSFSRWGDGEWNAVKGKKGHNCDGHEYYEDMSERLRSILLSQPKYLLGIMPKVYKTYNISDYPNKWYSSRVLYDAARDNKIQDFFDLLNTKDLIVVGNLKIMSIREFINYRAFISIPSKDCWLFYKETLSIIKESIKHGSVVLYSASMMSNVLIDDIYHYDKSITQIDCGSLWPPYLGYATRSYHKEINP